MVKIFDRAIRTIEREYERRSVTKVFFLGEAMVLRTTSLLGLVIKTSARYKTLFDQRVVQRAKKYFLGESLRYPNVIMTDDD
jgi:hypothetical protein